MNYRRLLIIAISGIAIVGALVVSAQVDSGLSEILGITAIVMAMVNVVGGFMVTNKINSRATDVDHAGLATQVTLTFQDEVTAIERLSRETGKVEKLELKDHAFTFNLPAGTGDLFKYASGGPFVGVQQ